MLRFFLLRSSVSSLNLSDKTRRVAKTPMKTSFLERQTNVSYSFRRLKEAVVGSRMFARILEFIFLEGFERRWTGAKSVVFRDSVKDVNAAVVQQRRLRDRAFGRRRADLAARQRLIADLLYGLEMVAFAALVFVEGHGRLRWYHTRIFRSISAIVAGQKKSWYKILCLLIEERAGSKNPGAGLGFFLAHGR